MTDPIAHDLLMVIPAEQLLRHPNFAAAREHIPRGCLQENAGVAVVEQFLAAIRTASVAEPIRAHLLSFYEPLLIAAKDRAELEQQRELDRVAYFQRERARRREQLHVQTDDQADRLIDLASDRHGRPPRIDDKLARRLEGELSDGVPICSWLLAAFDSAPAEPSAIGAWSPTGGVHAPARVALRVSALNRIWHSLTTGDTRGLDEQIAIVLRGDAIADDDVEKLTGRAPLEGAQRADMLAPAVQQP